MKTFKVGLLLLGLAFVTCGYDESVPCLMVYEEGGAPAVIQSPKCPHWNPSNDTSQALCQSARLKGRRKYQEDRTLCSFDLHIPFPGPAGIKDVTVGIVGIFDGHNGAEASELASELFLEYFTLHTHFLLGKTFSLLLKTPMGRLSDKGEHDRLSQTLNWEEDVDRHVLRFGRFKLSLSAIFDGSYHLQILKESLLRAIHDINATFIKEASRNNINSGSTATVILLADGQILVANVGDSKAILCSETFQSPSEAKATLLRMYRQQKIHDGGIRRRKGNGWGSKLSEASNRLAHFSAKELTRDHHPDRDDEKLRVESAGGYVVEWAGVPRVNGQLAVSRSIGDVFFKSYGVISDPEVTEWKILTANDSYLVATSDGVLEKQSAQDVCDLLWEKRQSHRSALADCIVDTAFEKGSMDNLAAVVIPLRSTASISKMVLKERFDDWPLRLRDHIYEESADNKASDDIEMGHTDLGIAQFDRLMVHAPNATNSSLIGGRDSNTASKLIQ